MASANSTVPDNPTVPDTQRHLIELAVMLALVGALTAGWANSMVKEKSSGASATSAGSGVEAVLNPSRTPDVMDDTQPEGFGHAALEIAGLADAR